MTAFLIHRLGISECFMSPMAVVCSPDLFGLSKKSVFPTNSRYQLLLVVWWWSFRNRADLPKGFSPIWVLKNICIKIHQSLQHLHIHFRNLPRIFSVILGWIYNATVSTRGNFNKSPTSTFHEYFIPCISNKWIIPFPLVDLIFSHLLLKYKIYMFSVYLFKSCPKRNNMYIMFVRMSNLMVFIYKFSNYFQAWNFLFKRNTLSLLPDNVVSDNVERGQRALAYVRRQLRPTFMSKLVHNCYWWPWEFLSFAFGKQCEQQHDVCLQMQMAARNLLEKIVCSFRSIRWYIVSWNKMFPNLR
jgi:hypothetical protein